MSRAKFFLFVGSPVKICLWKTVSNITDQQVNERSLMPAKAPGSFHFKGSKMPRTSDG